MQNNSTDAPRYVLFGRRKGRRLRGKKSELMENLLPRLTIAEGDAPLNLKEIFPAQNKIWLEVGFGGGEHLAAQAALHPDCGMIGCEPFINGIAGLLEHIDTQKLENIRIYPDDARRILDRLPESSLDRCFVLFPDPWPKKRHEDRRFIGPGNLPRLAHALKPGGELRVASDDPILQEWMIGHLQAATDFMPAADTVAGVFAERPAIWPLTRYEKKALAKKKYEGWKGPRYYSFLRR
jgi:tRNA (guanine-N7-)-methyltransferase